MNCQEHEENMDGSELTKLKIASLKYEESKINYENSISKCKSVHKAFIESCTEFELLLGLNLINRHLESTIASLESNEDEFQKNEELGKDLVSYLDRQEAEFTCNDEPLESHSQHQQTVIDKTEIELNSKIVREEECEEVPFITMVNKSLQTTPQDDKRNQKMQLSPIFTQTTPQDGKQDQRFQDFSQIILTTSTPYMADASSDMGTESSFSKFSSSDNDITNYPETASDISRQDKTNESSNLSIQMQPVESRMESSLLIKTLKRQMRRRTREKLSFGGQSAVSGHDAEISSNVVGEESLVPSLSYLASNSICQHSPLSADETSRKEDLSVFGNDCDSSASNTETESSSESDLGTSYVIVDEGHTDEFADQTKKNPNKGHLDDEEESQTEDSILSDYVVIENDTSINNLQSTKDCNVRPNLKDELNDGEGDAQYDKENISFGNNIANDPIDVGVDQTDSQMNEATPIRGKEDDAILEDNDFVEDNKAETIPNLNVKQRRKRRRRAPILNMVEYMIKRRRKQRKEFKDALKEGQRTTEGKQSQTGNPSQLRHEPLSCSIKRVSNLYSASRRQEMGQVATAKFRSPLFLPVESNVSISNIQPPTPDKEDYPGTKSCFAVLDRYTFTPGENISADERKNEARRLDKRVDEAHNKILQQFLARNALNSHDNDSLQTSRRAKRNGGTVTENNTTSDSLVLVENNIALITSKKNATKKVASKSNLIKNATKDNITIDPLCEPTNNVTIDPLCASMNNFVTDKTLNASNRYPSRKKPALSDDLAEIKVLGNKHDTDSSYQGSKVGVKVNRASSRVNRASAQKRAAPNKIVKKGRMTRTNGNQAIKNSEKTADLDEDHLCEFKNRRREEDSNASEKRRVLRSAKIKGLEDEKSNKMFEKARNLTRTEKKTLPSAVLRRRSSCSELSSSKLDRLDEIAENSEEANDGNEGEDEFIGEHGKKELNNMVPRTRRKRSKAVGLNVDKARDSADIKEDVNCEIDNERISRNDAPRTRNRAAKDPYDSRKAVDELINVENCAKKAIILGINSGGEAKITTNEESDVQSLKNDVPVPRGKRSKNQNKAGKNVNKLVNKKEEAGITINEENDDQRLENNVPMPRRKSGKRQNKAEKTFNEVANKENRAKKVTNEARMRVNEENDDQGLKNDVPIPARKSDKKQNKAEKPENDLKETINETRKTVDKEIDNKGLKNDAPLPPRKAVTRRNKAGKTVNEGVNKENEAKKETNETRMTVGEDDAQGLKNDVALPRRKPVTRQKRAEKMVKEVDNIGNDASKKTIEEGKTVYNDQNSENDVPMSRKRPNRMQNEVRKTADKDRNEENEAKNENTDAKMARNDGPMARRKAVKKPNKTESSSSRIPRRVLRGRKRTDTEVTSLKVKDDNPGREGKYAKISELNDELLEMGGAEQIDELTSKASCKDKASDFTSTLTSTPIKSSSDGVFNDCVTKDVRPVSTQAAANAIKNSFVIPEVDEPVSDLDEGHGNGQAVALGEERMQPGNAALQDGGEDVLTSNKEAKDTNDGLKIKRPKKRVKKKSHKLNMPSSELDYLKQSESNKAPTDEERSKATEPINIREENSGLLNQVTYAPDVECESLKNGQETAKAAKRNKTTSSESSEAAGCEVQEASKESVFSGSNGKDIARLEQRPDAEKEKLVNLETVADMQENEESRNRDLQSTILGTKSQKIDGKVNNGNKRGKKRSPPNKSKLCSTDKTCDSVENSTNNHASDDEASPSYGKVCKKSEDIVDLEEHPAIEVESKDKHVSCIQVDEVANGSEASPEKVAHSDVTNNARSKGPKNCGSQKRFPGPFRNRVENEHNGDSSASQKPAYKELTMIEESLKNDSKSEQESSLQQVSEVEASESTENVNCEKSKPSEEANNETSNVQAKAADKMSPQSEENDKPKAVGPSKGKLRNLKKTAASNNDCSIDANKDKGIETGTKCDGNINNYAKDASEVGAGRRSTRKVKKVEPYQANQENIVEEKLKQKRSDKKVSAKKREIAPRHDESNVPLKKKRVLFNKKNNSLVHIGFSTLQNTTTMNTFNSTSQRASLANVSVMSSTMQKFLKTFIAPKLTKSTS